MAQNYLYNKQKFHSGTQRDRIHFKRGFVMQSGEEKSMVLLQIYYLREEKTKFELRWSWFS